MARFRHRIAIVAAALVAASLPVIDFPAASAADPPILWGARPAGRDGQNDQEALDALQAEIGQDLRAVRIFETWEQSWPDAYANGIKAAGQIPLLSIKPKRDNGTKITWRSIADAQAGSPIYQEIVGWATKLKNYGGPVYFVFHHEPEATANLAYGTAADFKDAWRRVVDVLRAQGVTNATYLWTMTDYSFWAPSTERRQAAKWYPGDAWVDAIGADAYNWYTCRGANEGWRSLEKIITPLRDFGLAHPGKQLWLPEWASVEDPANPTRKAQWIADARALFEQPGFSQFVGIAYFHNEHDNAQYPACDWWVDTSQASLDAFTAMGDDPFYGGQRTVLFVVGNPAAMTTGDTQAVDHLNNLGMSVTVADDDTVTAADAAGRSAVLMSGSVKSSFGSRFRSLAVPVVVWKPWLYDDFDLTGTVANVSYNNATTASVQIMTTGHHLAAGRTGTVAVYTSAQTVAVGVPAATATTVATANGTPGLFVYKAGAALFSGAVAPACRIAFPASGTSMAAFTADGWALFEQAVTDAVFGCARD